MNILLKIGTALITGVAVFMTLNNGFGKKSETSEKNENSFFNRKESNDSSFNNMDDNLDTDKSQRDRKESTGDNLRSVQGVFNNLGNFLNSIITIVDTLSRIFSGQNENYGRTSTILV